MPPPKPTQHVNPLLPQKSKKEQNPEYYLEGIRAGNRFILSECITLLESTRPEKRALAENILEQFKEDNSTIRIGITGTPGVGKSTFIEALGMFLIKQGHHPAVLAIDPSSTHSKGSILGDKTRMARLSGRDEAYIRPTPSGAILGGTALYTKDTIRLCEAAGFDVVLVETVGVGQSETEVNHITDVNLLLLQPGAGDDIQGIKRGIMENADIFIINKADGPQLELAKQAKRAYRNALQLFHHEMEEWKSPIILVSSVQDYGMEEVYQAIQDYKKLLIDKSIFEGRRREQDMRWFSMKSRDVMENIILGSSAFSTMYAQLKEDVLHQKTTISAALDRMRSVLSSLIEKSNKK
ncbi:MAG: methylmalonyl Co-A mutase-associated GTPase MeaB [Saprospiraceae bacterium]|nr:MAG: LAO/AO transport system ATPase [Bacteroidetes bacterium OLB9]MCO6464852.1 methylmalonyl Co-A mutase-associated GTPase MeaB [Saprospiraceae bacterium]